VSSNISAYYCTSQQDNNHNMNNTTQSVPNTGNPRMDKLLMQVPKLLKAYGINTCHLTLSQAEVIMLRIEKAIFAD